MSSMGIKRRTATAAVAAGALALGGVTVSVAVAGSSWSTYPIHDESGQEMEKRGTAPTSLQNRHSQAVKASALSQKRVRSQRTSVAERKPGPRGPRGKRGPRGPRGLPGSVSVYTVTSPILTVPAGDYGDYVATCSSGGKAISGGFVQEEAVLLFANTSAPVETKKWRYSITNASSSTEAAVYFVTTCVR